MPGIAFIDHAGRRVLHLDLRGASVQETIALMRSADDAMAGEADRTVLTLIDVTDAAVDPTVAEAVHDSIRRGARRRRATAVVGIEGRQRWVFNVAAAFLGDGIEQFANVGEALDWLVSR